MQKSRRLKEPPIIYICAAPGSAVLPANFFRCTILCNFAVGTAYTEQVDICKGGLHMEPRKPIGDVDDLIFQDGWEVSQR